MTTTHRIVLTLLATVLGFFIGATLSFGVTLLLAWCLSYIPVLRDDGYVLPTILMLLVALFSVAGALTGGIHVYRTTGPKRSQPHGFDVLQKK